MDQTDIRLLSAGSVEPALVRAVEAYGESDQGRVEIAWATTPTILSRVGAGEVFDLLILTSAAADTLAEAGKLRREAHARLGSVGVGIAVREGASVPDIGCPSDVERALERAESVIFTLATSGLYVESMLRREGLFDRLLPKITRFQTGPQMMEHLARSRGEVLCLGAIVELMMFHGRGIHCVGPLPAPWQHATDYVVARTTDSRHPEAAAAFARYLITTPARAIFAQCGVDVAGL
jgi:molybdate transport system substrate-binding protein